MIHHQFLDVSPNVYLYIVTCLDYVNSFIVRHDALFSLDSNLGFGET
jgi:hypothetical protein